MLTTRVAIGVLGLACMTAAGGGAYLATRKNAADGRLRAGTDQARANAEPKAAAVPAGTVAETEAVVNEADAGAGDAKSSESAPVRAATKAGSTGTRTADRAGSASAPAPRANTTSRARPSESTRSATRGAPAPLAAPGDVSTRSPASSSRPAAPAPSSPARTEPSVSASAADSSFGRASEPAAAPEGPDRQFPSRSESEPPPKLFDELVVSADSVIGLQIETAASSERARLEDRIEARVARDVRVGDQVAIPAGSRVLGSITQVERGGKIKERARLGIRFHTLVLADGTRTPLNTETVYREGAPPSSESAAKIGGAAVGGAILGAILGGSKGAAMGGAAGAAGGTAAVMAGDRNPATLPAGTTVTVRVLAPVTVTVQKLDHDSNEQ